MGGGGEGKHREILGPECRTQKIRVAFVLGQGQGKQQAFKFLTEVWGEVPWCQCNFRLKMKLKTVILMWQSPCQIVEVTSGSSWKASFTKVVSGINKTVGSYKYLEENTLKHVRNSQIIDELVTAHSDLKRFP